MCVRYAATAAGRETAQVARVRVLRGGVCQIHHHRRGQRAGTGSQSPSPEGRVCVRYTATAAGRETAQVARVRVLRGGVC